ncbi:hypothetical protein M758_3G244900 [Ceratodon purpureus]|nr:hypothetical protein M758_3G244900 [Ceratodon purpureus]
MKRGGGSSNGGAPLLSPTGRKVPQSPTSGLGSLSLQEKEGAGGQEFASTTTFVQVDTSSFRELVQKLTGASDSDVEKLPITLPSRQASRGGGGGGGGGDGSARPVDNTYGGLIPKPVGDLSARRPAFKLHERRQSNLRKLDVKGLGAAAAFRRGVAGYGGGSPTPDLSPKFPSCIASPVTPLTKDVFESSHAPTTPTSYEGYVNLRPREPASAPAGGQDSNARLDRDPHFYLHPPSERPRQQPELLTLFPLTSPRCSETS